MPLWLVIWIARFASGERLRRTKREDYRYWFAAFLLFPISVALFLWFGGPVLQRSARVVWTVLIIFGVSDILVCLLSARYIPAAVSLVLAMVVWSVALWFAWHPALIPSH